MKYQNEMHLKVPALSVNEAFVRSTVAAFCYPLNPTLEEINDLKTAISEAVTNCVVHGYEGKGGDIEIWAGITATEAYVTVRDFGVGIPDVNKALQPFFTTKPAEERSGMGFTVMQAFMDDLQVESAKGNGTTVKMMKSFLPTSDEVDNDNA